MDVNKDKAERAMCVWAEAMRDVLAQKTEDCIIPGQMDRYVLGDLPDEEAKEITLHMAFCGHCRKQYIHSTIRVQLDKGIFQLPDLREWAAEGITEAKKILTDLTKWLQDLFQPIELQPVRVHGAVRNRGAVRTRGAAPRQRIEAKVLDTAGKSTGESLTFAVREGPRIEDGKFILKLETSETKYEGYIAHVILKKEETKLELCSTPLQKAEDQKALTVEALADLGEIALKPALVPLKYLKVVVQTVGART